MDKNYVIIALVSALATFLLMAILGAVLLEDEPTNEPQTQDTVQTDNEFNEYTSSNIREGFIEGCMSEGGSRDFCTCGAEKVNEEYSLMEIAEMGSENEYPDKFWDMMRQCKTETNAQQI